MAKGIDGIGLAIVGVGAALVYAGINGYSLLAVLENLIVGKPIHTDVKFAEPLTVDSLTKAAGRGDRNG